MNTHTVVTDTHQNVLKMYEAAAGKKLAVSDTRSLHVVE